MNELNQAIREANAAAFRFFAAAAQFTFVMFTQAATTSRSITDPIEAKIVDLYF